MAQEPTTSTAAHPRLQSLDALRGFALAGIIFVNIGPILGLGLMEPGGATSPVYLWLQDFVENRFFPIFSLLFGVSFAMLWESAARQASPRMALLRRLMFLGVLGAGHEILQPGEALLPYAVCGLVLLLPATFLPAASAASRRWTAGLLILVGAGLLTAGVVAGGGLSVVPGLFLIGYALGFLRVPARLAAWRHTSWLSGSSAIVGVAVILSVFGGTTRTERLVPGPLTSGLGLLMAATYVCGFIFLLTTPVGGALRTVFAPLGRMACTNYLTATLLIVAFRGPLSAEYDLAGGSPDAWRLAMLACVVILALQWAWSRLWLRAFAYGPVEYLWRWATWLKRPRLLLSERDRGDHAVTGSPVLTGGRATGEPLVGTVVGPG